MKAAIGNHQILGLPIVSQRPKAAFHFFSQMAIQKSKAVIANPILRAVYSLDTCHLLLPFPDIGTLGRQSLHFERTVWLFLNYLRIIGNSRSDRPVFVSSTC